MSLATRIDPEVTVHSGSASETSSFVSIVIPGGIRLKTTQADFERLAAANQDLRLELTAAEDLVVMAPEGLETGAANFLIAGQLFLWTQVHGGVGFGSSAGFTLPSGAIRSPDATWISAERWNGMPPQEKQGFARIVPDFVIELRSPSDNIDELLARMEEYAAAGVRLGWLIDPDGRTVTIHRPGQQPRMLENPERVSGEEVLPGFDLETRAIFSDSACIGAWSSVP